MSSTTPRKSGPSYEAASAQISQDELRARVLRLDEEYREARDTGEPPDVRDEAKIWLEQEMYSAA